MDQELHTKLIRLGFSGKESSIYLALLELGKAPISEIAKKAGINRTTVYDIIVSLEKDGFVSRSIDPTKKIYAAEPPQKIPVVLEHRSRQLAEQAKEATTLIDALSLVSAKSPAKPKIKIFEGTDGVKALYDASLTCKSYIRSFLNSDALEAFDKEYVNAYFRRRSKKNIFIQGIMNDSPLSREYKRVQKEYKREVRLVSKEEMDVVPEVYIYDDTISIFSLKEKLGMSIESKDVANAFKKLYDLAWQHAGEKSATPTGDSSKPTRRASSRR